MVLSTVMKWAFSLATQVANHHGPWFEGLCFKAGVELAYDVLLPMTSHTHLATAA
jgi:hypothetical protein